MALIAVIMCGILVTWATAGFGYWMFRPHGCGNSPKLTRIRVAEAASGITHYQIDNAFRCPTRDQLVDQHYVGRGTLVDSWGTSITFHCSADSDLFVVFVRSAGPDKVFHTADDITND